MCTKDLRSATEVKAFSSYQTASSTEVPNVSRVSSELAWPMHSISTSIISRKLRQAELDSRISGIERNERADHLAKKDANEIFLGPDPVLGVSVSG